MIWQKREQLLQKRVRQWQTILRPCFTKQVQKWALMSSNYLKNWLLLSQVSKLVQQVRELSVQTVSRLEKRLDPTVIQHKEKALDLH